MPGGRLVRGQLVDGLAVPEDLALARPVDAADGHERGGLAGAVGTDEGHDLAVIHAQGNVAQGLDVAVVGINCPDFKHLRFLPDRRMTRGLLRTSAGVPAAMREPYSMT